jgi:superfamily II DNA/RNA helicase
MDVQCETTNSSADMSFETWEDDNVNIKNKLLRGVYGYGFEKPSPIQKKAIIPLSLGKDVIAQAQSGTGKTGAFTIGALQVLDEKLNETQVLILSPTRELSRQTHTVISALSMQMNVNCKLLVGGTSIDEDKRDLDTKPHVIIGCPGRVHDMMKRGYLKTGKIRMFILDEADEMLSSGFKDQIYNVFQYLSSQVQVALFSATMPPELETLTAKFMRNPVQIRVKQEMLTLQGIKQYYVAVDNDEDKFLVLKDIFSLISVSQCIIYCNSIKRTEDLFSAMKMDDFPVIQIHSDMTEEERKEAYTNFKCGQARVLISTDLFSRGIDIQQVSVVINFDVPKSVHTYLHRIGRSGRWGRKGVGINFVTKRDMPRLTDIEKHYSTKIDELPNDFMKDAY